MSDFQKLADPFPPEDIEWRVGRSGMGAKGPWAKVLAYLTSRAIMHRLDSVIGPANWKDEYQKGPEGGILCGISIRVPVRTGTTIPGNDPVFGQSEWVTKWDGAENTQIESVKGGLSDSFKRAAVKWGIGRYLYRLEEGWAEIADDNDRDAYQGEAKDKSGAKVYFKWYPPRLPDFALPAGYNAKPQADQPATLTAKKMEPTAQYKSFITRLDEKVKAKVLTKEPAWKASMTFAHQLGYDHAKLQACSDPSVFTAIFDKLLAPTHPRNGNVVKQPVGAPAGEDLPF
jgi:hypothetical protein